MTRLILMRTALNRFNPASSGLPYLGRYHVRMHRLTDERVYHRSYA